MDITTTETRAMATRTTVVVAEAAVEIITIVMTMAISKIETMAGVVIIGEGTMTEGVVEGVIVVMTTIIGKEKLVVAVKPSYENHHQVCFDIST